MSNYHNLEYCLTCRKVTKHEWQDDTPRHHEYAVVCLVCGLSTEAVNFHHIDAQNMLDLSEGDSFDRLKKPKTLRKL